ncbi:hypothetical protein VTK56DRAFT_6619 [Thermocarpiscus australiensis]
MPQQPVPLYKESIYMSSDPAQTPSLWPNIAFPSRLRPPPSHHASPSPHPPLGLRRPRLGSHHLAPAAGHQPDLRPSRRLHAHRGGHERGRRAPQPAGHTPEQVRHGPVRAERGHGRRQLQRQHPVRFGADRSYMTERTALHEISHTLGIGQTQAFDARCIASSPRESGQQTGLNANRHKLKSTLLSCHFLHSLLTTPLTLTTHTTRKTQTQSLQYRYQFSYSPHIGVNSSPHMDHWHPKIKSSNAPPAKMACGCQRHIYSVQYASCTARPRHIVQQVRFYNCANPGSQNCTGYVNVYFGASMYRMPGAICPMC